MFMKRVVPLLLLSAFLAGCAADQEPESDDPAMGMPVPSSGVDDTETLPEDTSEPTNGFAPQQGHQEAASDDVSLVGDFFVEECGDAYCIHAKATNEGGADRFVSDICVSPWSETMQQRDSEVQKSEPYAVCMAWGLRPFEPGESVEMDFTWDGRLWDDDAQEYRSAPEDSYTWSIHFRYYDQDDGSGGETLTVAFPVIVGET